MGKWIIFLLSLAVASVNGFNIETWVWVVTGVIIASGLVVTVIEAIENNRRK